MLDCVAGFKGRTAVQLYISCNRCRRLPCGKIRGFALDSVQGLKELKIFKADQAQHKKMNGSSEEFRKITMKVLVMQLASTTIMDLVAYGGAGAGTAIAVCGVIFRGLDPVSALFLILVAVEFFLPLRAFGSAFHVAMNGASAGRKIISLLEMPDPVWGNDSVINTDLRLSDVTFSYDGKREAYNGIDVDEIDSENLPDNVTMVSQNTYLFDESIEENLRIAKPNATME